MKEFLIHIRFILFGLLHPSASKDEICKFAVKIGAITSDQIEDFKEVLK